MIKANTIHHWQLQQQQTGTSSTTHTPSSSCCSSSLSRECSVDRPWVLISPASAVAAATARQCTAPAAQRCLLSPRSTSLALPSPPVQHPQQLQQLQPQLLHCWVTPQGRVCQLHSREQQEHLHQVGGDSRHGLLGRSQQQQEQQQKSIFCTAAAAAA